MLQAPDIDIASWYCSPALVSGVYEEEWPRKGISKTIDFNDAFSTSSMTGGSSQGTGKLKTFRLVTS